MKRVLLISLMIFLLFGMLLHTPIVFADENNNSGSSNNSEDDDNSTANDSDGDEDINDSDEDDLNETEDDNDENETEDDEDKDNRDRIKIRSREIITRGNCTIKIERELKIENGKRVEVVKKKMVCADGTREEVKIRIEKRTDDGRIRERKEYKIKARFRGNVTDIKIMPDRASEIAIERLRALNFTVELREVSRKGNVSRIVYHARAYKDGRFIGILKLKVRVETQIDPETGEIIMTSKPWWAFFVFGEDSDQTGEDTGEDAEEENETNELTINLSEQNNSGETETATLVEENGQVVPVSPELFCSER